MFDTAMIAPPDVEALAMLDTAGYVGFEARQWAKGSTSAALRDVLEAAPRGATQDEYVGWLLLAVAAHEELFQRSSSCKSLH